MKTPRVSPNEIEARAKAYIEKVQQDNVAMGQRRASEEDCAKAVRTATEAAYKVVGIGTSPKA